MTIRRWSSSIGRTGITRKAKLSVTPMPGRILGNAGLFSTARDLLRWADNFADARVGDRRLLAEMQKPAVLTSGESGPYGLGVWVEVDRGVRCFNHGGGDPCYGAFVARYPDHGLSIALLCNLDNAGWTAGSLTRSIAEIYLSEALSSSSAPASAPSTSAVSLSSEQLARWVGLYSDPRNGTLGRVFVRDGKLMASGNPTEQGDVFELTPLTPTRVGIAGTPIVAELLATDGRPSEIRVTGNSRGPK
jgi:hypothetical protein